MSNRFQDKTVLVLGGTSGIGRAVAETLAEQGARVTVASRRGDAPVPGNVQSAQVDVLDREGLESLFAELAPIDYLVNAATGGERAVGPFLDMDLDGFQNSFAKLWGYVNSVRLGAKYMAPDGAMVLISGYPARKCMPGMSAISTVGNAVEGFVRAVAPEIAPLRLNAVAPGLIDTPMMLQQGEERDTFFREATKHHVIKRAGLAEEVAEAVVFLLGNQFVTGTVVDVDGGALLP